MSIFKSTFKPAIQTQLKTRQEAILKRTPSAIQYLNSRTAWIKMSSSVNVEGSNDLASKYILLGGTLNEGKLRSGVGNTNVEAYSPFPPSYTLPGNRLGIRPMPGITSIDVKSKSAYGSLREVEVKFNAWDIRQLEDLELLYMRPGYTVLIEWGWIPYLKDDNIDSLQVNIDFNQNDIINKTPNKDQLFKNIYDTAVTTYQGNYDAMFGYVKNYGWSTRPDGGYDCSVTVISIGEVLESLTVNYSPINNMNQILQSNGLLMGSYDLDDDDELKNAYTKNILAGLFYEIWTIGYNKATNAEKFVIEDKKKNSSYNIFRKVINIHGAEGTEDGTGEVGASDEQIYITLESLCTLMNNYVIAKDSNSESSYVKCSVFEREYEYGPLNPNPSTGEGGYLLCLAHPLQISMDPTICLINSPLWISGQLPSINVIASLNSSNEGEETEDVEDQQEETTEAATDALEFLKNLNPFFYKGDYKEEMGIIGNIYVNVNYLFRLSLNNDLESRDTKEKNDINLYNYLKQILSDISSTIGNVNNFDIHIDPVDSVVRIIDINYVEAEKNRDSVYENIFQLEMHNAKSTVRSYKLESQIFPDQASIIAIGAQDGGGAMATDNNTMLDFNKGLTDRIIPKKRDALNDPNTTAAENAASQIKSLETILDIFYGYFQRLKVGWFDDSDFNVEKSDQYKNALKNLIDFYKNLTNSDIKNRSIIPTKLSVTLDGIGGLVIGQMFKIPEDLLPRGYKGEKNIGSKLGYIITGIGHSIANNDWTTEIEAQTVILSNPAGEDLTFSDIIEGEGNEKVEKKTKEEIEKVKNKEKENSGGGGSGGSGGSGGGSGGSKTGTGCKALTPDISSIPDSELDIVKGPFTTNSGKVEELAVVDNRPVGKDVAKAIILMKRAALKDKINLRVNSGFRSPYTAINTKSTKGNTVTAQSQKELYAAYKAGNGNLAASPGTSNHGNAFAFDLNTGSVNNPGRNGTLNKPLYQWLINNAYKFGFVRRVATEEWHWEYLPGTYQYNDKVPRNNALYRGMNVDSSPCDPSSSNTKTTAQPTRQENINSVYCGLVNNKVSGGFYKGKTWEEYKEAQSVTIAEENIAKQSCPKKEPISAVLIGGLDYRKGDKNIDEQLKLFKEGYGVGKNVKAFRYNTDTLTITNFIKDHPNIDVIMFSAGCVKANSIALIPDVNKNKIYIVECYATSPGTKSVVQAAVKNGVPAKNVFAGPYDYRGAGAVKGESPSGGSDHWQALKTVGEKIK